MWALDSIIAFFALAAGVVGQDERPNIIVIVVDDQDFHMGSLPYMTEVSEHLVSAGTLFEKHYCTSKVSSANSSLVLILPVAICCPSRVDLWTGQMSHNTNVTNVQPPWGSSLPPFSHTTNPFRRIPKVHREWIQRSPPRSMDAGIWIQHVLCRKALQWTLSGEL